MERDDEATTRQVTRNPVEFPGGGGLVLRGEMWAPDADPPFPCVVIPTAQTGGEDGPAWILAERLASKGIAVLTYVVRGFAESLSGTPFDQDIEMELRDHRDAITFAIDQSDIDSSRIGFQGTGLRGGEAIVIGATDRRTKCIVAQVPQISGSAMAKRLLTPDGLADLRLRFNADRVNILHGEEPLALPNHVPEAKSEGGAKPLSYIEGKGYEHFSEMNRKRKGPEPKMMTLRSRERFYDFEPGFFVSLVSPTPLLMIVPENDELLGGDLQLKAFAEALEPKKLVMTPGDHFDVYFGPGFERATDATINWFTKWLL
jgi:fermentation-respiration switch protein FrsA (DUF1100 family)